MDSKRNIALRFFKRGITSPIKIQILCTLYFVLCTHLISLGQLFPKLGAQRAGISSMTFLKMDPSPRSSALGGANICLSGDGYSIYTNPAAMVDNKSLTFAASNSFRVAGVNNVYFAVQLPDKRRGVWGLSVQSLNSQPMEVRTVLQPNGTGELFYVSSNAVGLTYSRLLTERFSFGLSFKYLNENIAQYTSNALGVDLAFLYRLDFKDFKFAALVQNFGSNSHFSGNYTPPSFGNTTISISDYTIPTQFILGVGMTPYRSGFSEFGTYLQLNQPNDNSANLRLGIEYRYRNIFFIRGGYVVGNGDNYLPTFGFGLKTRLFNQPFVFDFASEPTPYTGWIQTIGLSLSFVKREKNVQEGN